MIPMADRFSLLNQTTKRDTIILIEDKDLL